MSDKNNKNSHQESDLAIAKRIGDFVKQQRLQQNKTQTQLATEAGINRSTLVEFEKGKRANMMTFIQILRTLNLLQLLEAFKETTQISPLLLAEMEQNKRKRARSTKTSKKKSAW